ncbi:MAG: DUF4397 domain-containing protein [Gemmatimonadota bacterium]|nr:DUF4397 domain-containing protein [Gemmatimonadota bacterium]
MRLSRLVALFVAVVAIAGCGSDKVTDPSFPALAGVRFINAVNDTSALDFRAIDQVQFSPVANALAYRGATEYQPTEAKDRHFRVFVTSQNQAIASNPIDDETITFAADGRYTLLLTGSARTPGSVKFVMINDTPPTPAAGQIAVRTGNSSAIAIDNYLVDSTNTAIAGSPTIPNVAPGELSAYIVRSTGKQASRVTPAGSATVSASTQGPPAPATPVGAIPAAGVTTSGTAFTIFYFQAGVPGSPTAPASGTANCAGAAPALTCNPTVVWYVDKQPTQ